MLRQEGRLDLTCSSLNSLFCQPWHSRIWTVQEVAFSRNCQVVCGKATLSWETYSAAARFLIFEQEIEQLDPRAHKSWIAIDMRNIIREYLHQSSSSLSNLSLEDKEDEQNQTVTFLSSCLGDVIQLQATDARDKIYGLQPLYSNLGIPLPAADYVKSTSRVYEDAAVALILWSGTLDVLGDAIHIHRRDKFPSWVPDWSNNEVKIYAPQGAATDYSRIFHSSQEILNPTTGELHVRGKLVGKVSAWKIGRYSTWQFPTRLEQCSLPVSKSDVGALLEDAEFTNLWIRKTRFFRQLCSSLRKFEKYCEEEVDDILLELLKQNSYPECNKEFNVWLDIIKYPETTCDLSFAESNVEKWRTSTAASADRWNAELTSCAVIMFALITNSIQRSGQHYDSSGILALIAEFSTNLADKKFMLMDIDALGMMRVGTCLTLVRSGDYVVLLEGARWPVILRLEGRGWRFMGPAFIPGIMDGEAWLTKAKQPNNLSLYVLV
jgi:hypothetical protein